MALAKPFNEPVKQDLFDTAMHVPSQHPKYTYTHLCIHVIDLIEPNALHGILPQLWGLHRLTELNAPSFEATDLSNCFRAEQSHLSAVIKLYNSRPPNTTTVKATISRRKTICTLQQRGL
ncbi:unnamed protein product [Polarella glacialis]|uniref:Uncharacterized protein n=1 Tax=Polarella glacialis TaxID=89957 RepID=A0A813EAI3_POLGL|nr:unnamed protein product [Polarella glacialis]CAE8599085.1 unnamed protein product [Polarella glacialis]